MPPLKPTEELEKDLAEKLVLAERRRLIEAGEVQFHHSLSGKAVRLATRLCRSLDDGGQEFSFSEWFENPDLALDRVRVYYRMGRKWPPSDQPTVDTPEAVLQIRLSAPDPSNPTDQITSDMPAAYFYREVDFGLEVTDLGITDSEPTKPLPKPILSTDPRFLDINDTLDFIDLASSIPAGTP